MNRPAHGSDTPEHPSDQQTAANPHSSEEENLETLALFGARIDLGCRCSREAPASTQSESAPDPCGPASTADSTPAK